jgi:hypothetical protein
MFCCDHLVDLYEALFIDKAEIVALYNVYLNCTQIRQNVIKSIAIFVDFKILIILFKIIL